MHPGFKEEFNPSAHDESFESYFAARRVRPSSSTPTPTPSPPPAPTVIVSAPNSSVRGSDVGKKQKHKEKLKFAGLDDSDGSALTQSGDEGGDSSPPPQIPSGPGTEVGTEAGEEEEVEMAERSSPGEYPFCCRLYGMGVLFCSGSHILLRCHRTGTSHETRENSERSQERCTWTYSFECGRCIL